MNKQRQRSSKRIKRQQSGTSLIELMMALLILLVVTVNVMAMAFTALTTTESQGHLAARTAEYAQDKMEQLLSLTFCDGSSDTTKFPAPPGGGAGLAGCPGPAAATGPGFGGSANPAAPVAQYVDYLDRSGNLLVAGAGGPPAGWYYIRVWAITNLPGAVNPGNGISNQKQITVTTQVRFGVAGNTQALPQSTVAVVKSFPF